MQTSEYDYIIIGGGLSGLQLAYALSNDTYFETKRIAVIEPSSKLENDKTWSFWEKGAGKWDDIVHKSWSTSKIYGRKTDIPFTISPYTYKSIRSIDFYTQVLLKLKNSPNVTWINDKVINLTEAEKVSVETVNSKYIARHVFDSRLPSEFKENMTSVNLLQHFKGVVVKVDTPIFNAEEFVMMDYRIVHEDTCSFTYILPFDEYTALVEYTFFSPESVEEEVYDEKIVQYLKTILNIDDYEIIEEERGVIPMSTYTFWNHNSKDITKIGTAGGWVKASSGYSFKNTENKIEKIITNLKAGKPIVSGLYSKKFQFYDAVFLNVLFHNNQPYDLYN